MQQPEQSSHDEDALSKEFDEIVAKERTREEAPGTAPVAARTLSAEKIAVEHASPVQPTGARPAGKAGRDIRPLPGISQVHSSYRQKSHVEVRADASPVAASITSDVKPTTDPTHDSAVTLVLQWLSNSFWTWFAFSMLWLSAMVVGYFMSSDVQGEGWGEVVPYPIASSLVLLVVALIIDVLYAKREPAHKKGFASFILIFHTIIYMIFLVSALIGIVVALITMVVQAGSAGGTTGAVTAALSALVFSVILGVLMLRYAYGARKKSLRIATWVGFSLLTLVMVGVAIAGPVVSAISARQDRLIERALPDLATAINDYASEKKSLPTDLSAAVSFASSYSRQEVETLVGQDIVRYTPNVKTEMATASSSSSGSSKTSSVSAADLKSAPYPGVGKVYYYKLCVTYKYAKNNGSGSYTKYADDYNEYLSTSSHSAGEKCYNMSTSYYSTQYDSIR